MNANFIDVQCVYGDEHVHHIENVLIPSLIASTKRYVRLHVINYKNNSDKQLVSKDNEKIKITNFDNPFNESSGFAKNHNLLFNETKPESYFFLVNPDCILSKGSIDRLIERKQYVKNAGIIEGRQWPFEHPKEYDSLSYETPWASGAFCLVDSDFYAKVGGMDERYFLYTEDVDLSWMAWISGYKVIYEPDAAIIHFSGGPFYRNDIVNAESYLSLRNFIILSRKFFGSAGEERAIAMLKNFHDRQLAELAIDEYFSLIDRDSIPDYSDFKNPNIKILGLNLFHRMKN